MYALARCLQKSSIRISRELKKEAEKLSIRCEKIVEKALSEAVERRRRKGLRKQSARCCKRLERSRRTSG
ncbi:MAG: hypothetical protein ACP5PQ_02890 [Thermoproteota archaeon]